MKWYDADKKKPEHRENVLVIPANMPLGYWDAKQKIWISALYPLPAYPYELKNIKKWAYIDYPKGSFEFLHSLFRRRNKWYYKIWKKILRR